MPIAFPTSFTSWEPALSLEEYEQYLTIANDVNIRNAKWSQEKLFHAFEDFKIDQYPGRKVFAYLDEKLGPNWEFFGVRKIDAEKLTGFSILESPEHRKIFFSSKPYSREIPLTILERIQNLVNYVPEIAVSITDEPTKDSHECSFLVVTSPGLLGTYICGHWKEHSFRG